MYEGHGFHGTPGQVSRAVNLYCAGTASAEVRFFTVISVQAQGWKSVPQGLKCPRENYSLSNLESRVGTAESSSGRQSWVHTRPVPEGRLRMSQDEILGALESDAKTLAWGSSAPRIASWGILSRPFGTDPLSVASQD